MPAPSSQRLSHPDPGTGDGWRHLVPVPRAVASTAIPGPSDRRVLNAVCSSFVESIVTELSKPARHFVMQSPYTMHATHQAEGPPPFVSPPPGTLLAFAEDALHSLDCVAVTASGYAAIRLRLRDPSQALTLGHAFSKLPRCRLPDDMLLQAPDPVPDVGSRGH